MTVTARAARSRTPARRLNPRLLRDLHLYLAVFFAPAIIFFAMTGVVQELGLHEASRDGSFRPAPIVEKLAQVHIHQRFAAPPRRSGGPSAATAAARPAAAAQPRQEAARQGPSPATTLTKWFFALSAVGLTLTSLLGVWIALTQSRHRILCWALLGLGGVIPILLLAL